uniref:Ferritin n=1 Tax=Panagrellus redivivus TaxID=6233 RepID=A0A7E4ZWT0_PANRE
MAHARQNFSAPVERALNQQINNELFASYTYLAMSAHFGNAEVALPGAAAYFKNQAYEEREHAEKIIDYINDRGEADLQLYITSKSVPKRRRLGKEQQQVAVAATRARFRKQ